MARIDRTCAQELGELRRVINPQRRAVEGALICRHHLVALHRQLQTAGG